MRVEEGFQPVPYVEGNPYTTDPVLPRLLRRLLPADVLNEVEADLERFGDEVLTTVRTLGQRAQPPTLVQYDHFGRRVDELRTSEGWRGLKAKMQSEGIPGIFYERKFGEHSRVWGFVKTMMATPEARVIFCPLSMTDGCARVLELIGSPAAQQDIYPRLISRDPQDAFTAGQWMTERPGGSDVSLTETTATPLPSASSPYGQVYSLDGFKWFSSATDSDVSLALARTGSIKDGSRGLSLFLVPLRRPLFPESATPGAPRASALTNNISVHRLKDKVGTKIVPTAELSLNGAHGYLLGSLGQGVKLITPVLNITRMHSAIGSLAYIRRALAVASAYAQVRRIHSGKHLLSEVPVHVAELARGSLTYRALAHMVFGIVGLLGKAEVASLSKDKTEESEEEKRLRLLTPVAKGFAAEKAATVIEEGMAALGGLGYMEEVGLGENLRDALVEKIWEGTITVLALDVVRAASKPGVLQAFASWANHIVASVPSSLTSISAPLSILRAALELLTKAYASPLLQSPTSVLPRPAFFLLSYIASSVYLLEHTIWAVNIGDNEKDVDIEVFRRWVVESGLVGVMAEVERVTKEETGVRVKTDRAIVFGVKAQL